MCDPALRGSLALGLLARLRSLRWLPAAPLRSGVGGIAGSARARTRISASFLYENSKLNEPRHFSGSFKR
ncbi:hypothetical protein HMPREF1221_01000 [Treponema socranskii subsp. paredis ATCC 35535]|nr:hypothetical protein HMPREF1221_01000 [Treponema socranskii subsp. paredis ATCC 35535]